MPFGPLPNENLRMQDPNLKKPNGILDLHQPMNIDVISLFIFFMIMGLSIATSTVQRWQTAESKVVKAEAEKATAELSFLKAQINPHFLFNTLNNTYTQSVINSRKLYAAASKYFAKVVALYPFDYDGNHMLGWSLLFSGRKAEAKACFERALLIKPGDTSSHDGINRAAK